MFILIITKTPWFTYIESDIGSVLKYNSYSSTFTIFKKLYYVGLHSFIFIVFTRDRVFVYRAGIFSIHYFGY